MLPVCSSPMSPVCTLRARHAAHIFLRRKPQIRLARAFSLPASFSNPPDRFFPLPRSSIFRSPENPACGQGRRAVSRNFFLAGKLPKRSARDPVFTASLSRRLTVSVLLASSVRPRFALARKLRKRLERVRSLAASTPNPRIVIWLAGKLFEPHVMVLAGEIVFGAALGFVYTAALSYAMS
jgi:hypothetical protein